ncbi:hypothetical protein EYR36_002823 [Pleurotus pulmonarius]|nr:hypothetical protein EYR36_002823 [Pleurotus pulmonarius]
MAIHFYDKTPSPPGEQLARLKAGSVLVRAEIPFVVWGEDALSIVHRVPTALFDHHLLVQDDRVEDAVEIICNEIQYSSTGPSSDDRWRDHAINNPARPFAFGGTPTTLLQHNDPKLTCKTLEPERILVHAASTFKFPLDDLSRSCLNPTPPSPESARIRFPTVSAFYDTLIDTLFEPPLGYVHLRLNLHLNSHISYLNLYNVSDKGVTATSAPPGEFGIIPSCLKVLDQVKDENKVFLARRFLQIPFNREITSLERLLIRQARLKDKGVVYTIPPLPYHPHARSKGRMSPTPIPKLLQLRLIGFAQAIRDKKDWFLKVDSLANKWVQEADLMGESGIEVDLVELIWELKAEAHRIRVLDKTIMLRPPSLPERAIDSERIRNDVMISLKHSRRSKFAIRRADLRDDVGVYVSDGIIPLSLHRETSVLSRSEDYSSVHHSSAYAWIPSVFTVSDDGRDVHIDSYINGLGPREDYPTLSASFGSRTTDSIRRWEEREDLRPETYESEWDQLREKQAKEKEEALKREKEEKAKLAADRLKDWQNRPLSVDIGDPSPASSFKGRSLKVIVKAANYILKPGQNYDGAWHLEGMPHERIVSSSIYYYDSNDFVQDSGLGLRRIRDEYEDFPPPHYTWDENFAVKFLKPKGQATKEDQGQVDSSGDGDRDEDDWESDASYATYDYPSEWDEDKHHIYQGVVPTTYQSGSGPTVGHGTGRIISFPNWLQHKVMGIHRTDDDVSSGAVPAIRKILCFFLVEDDDNQEGDEEDSSEEDAADGGNDVVMEQDTHVDIDVDVEMDAEDNEGEEEEEGSEEEDRASEEEDEFCAGPGLTYTGVKGMRVLSTADVPDQRCRTNAATLRSLLPVICQRLIRKSLPRELAMLVVNSIDLGVVLPRHGLA